MTEAEAGELTELHVGWMSIKDELPDRVRHALWMFDYGFQIKYVDIAIPHYVTTLEALLNTDSHGSRRQFCERVCQLAKKVGVAGATLDWSRNTWQARSKAVHGERMPVGENGSSADVLEKLQEIARHAVRCCLVDPAFSSYFESDNSVRREFPI